ncbi:ectonucleotide pyrophosphatase/phosphodiesterase [Sphingobium sp. AN558]|uniref:alkaline phosphatase family protein n=1 Tax=Sphingobium sp. AN558 TaxID=3133442 RepID=UPI0030C5F8B7
MTLKTALLTAAVILAPVPALAEPVLFISIDGLRPGDVLEADKRGLKIPNLRRFLKEGAYASAVVGVLPTVTYPSHTTLMTGASPARHGILSNNTFDPKQINQGGWYWYATDVKVPMLWEAASKAGLTTGNIHWPVSVAARGVTWNLPQYWRTGHADDVKLLDALSTPGLRVELEQAVGEPYAQGIDETVESDQNRGKFAVALIDAHRPDFLTVYLTGLDHEQHAKGPGTPEAHAVLEKIDAIVGDLMAAETKAHPDAVIALASDHGFETVDHFLSLPTAFIDAGLITLGKDGKAIASWDAFPWSAGASSAIILARPDDMALAARVKALLERLSTEPVNGIDRVIGKAEIAKMGGNPDAAFYVNMKPGFVTDIFRGAGAPLNGPTPGTTKGMHGYFPGAPNLRSTFLIMGRGVKAGKDLGLIDMRAIAPTLAKIMDTRLLLDAELPALNVSDK